MSDIICPMLSALWPTDDDGQPVNRECIYERCRFFDTDHKDCSLMMANRAMLTMADKGLTDSAAETERVTVQIEHRLTDLRKDLLDSQREVLDTVRDTGRPTTDPGESIESIIPKIEEAVAGRLEQRLTDLRQELLNSHREVLDTVRDAGQRSADPGDFINSTIPKIEEAIARRLEEMQSRVSEASARRTSCCDSR